MTRTSPVIITFIGPVGVGKSTQSKLLKKYFKIKGKKVVDTYLRSAHGTSYIITVILRKIQGRSGSELVKESSSGKIFEAKFASFWNISDSLKVIRG